MKLPVLGAVCDLKSMQLSHTLRTRQGMICMGFAQFGSTRHDEVGISPLLES
jgi:hypothetical protein